MIDAYGAILIIVQSNRYNISTRKVIGWEEEVDCSDANLKRNSDCTGRPPVEGPIACCKSSGNAEESGLGTFRGTMNGKGI
jgi:hypothetical protein